MIKKILILSILILSIGEVGFSHEPPPLPAVSTAGDIFSKACTACIALPRSIQLSLQRTYMTKRATDYKTFVESFSGHLMGTGNTQVYVKPSELDYRKNPYLELYRLLNLPKAPVLRTNKQAMNYFLSEMNRAEIFAIKHQNQKAKELKDAIPALQGHLRPYTDPEEKDISWLAQQIPEDTQYLILAEWHETGLRPAEQQLVKMLRTRFGKRPIIFLTETLMKGDTSESDRPEFYHDPWLRLRRGVSEVLEEVENNQIPMFGLDPEYVVNYHFIFTNKDHEWGLSFWKSNFGIKVRNEDWLKTIEHIRQENPDALIVLYGGASHFLYTEPFSLGMELKKQAPTFLISFLTSWRNSPFDHLAPRNKFDQRILQFDPEYATTVGFDIQIKINAKEED